MATNNTFATNIVRPDGELVHFDDTVAIHITDKHYNLLVMKDHMPIIGEVTGSVVITGKENSYKMPNGVAYYICQENVFTIIIKNATSLEESSEAKEDDDE